MEALTTPIKKRLISIDVLRGYFLVVIIIDHLGRFPNMLEWFSGRGAMWVTAAEGFFFVSGLMVGLTTIPKIKTLGLRFTWIKMWKRSALLYAWAIVTTIIFTALSFHLGWAPKGGLTELRDWPTIIQQALTLHYSYGWSDFLPRYAIYMFIAPLAAYVIYKGLWWAVLWASLLAWFFWGPTNFNAAWQILFFGGMIVGYYLPSLRKWAQAWPTARQRLAYRSVTLAALCLLATSAVLCLYTFIVYDYGRYVAPLFEAIGQPQLRHVLSDTFSTWNTAVGEPLFSHDRMGIGRIAVFLIYFTAAFITLERYGQAVNKWLGWFFNPLGKHSLTTYIVHAAVLFAIDAYIPRQGQITVNLRQTLLAIISVWCLVIIISYRAKIWQAIVSLIKAGQTKMGSWVKQTSPLVIEGKIITQPLPRPVIVLPFLVIAALIGGLVLRLARSHLTE